MGRTDIVSEVFGIILVVVAALSVARERRAFRQRGGDAWLVTRRRYRRRLLVSLNLALVGLLFGFWGHGAINFYDASGRPSPGKFTLFVAVLSGLGLTLVILAAIDAIDTARNAARFALQEFALPEDAPGIGQPLEPGGAVGVAVTEADGARSSNKPRPPGAA